jgi:predicted AAA+ superfamily ATPase
MTRATESRRFIQVLAGPRQVGQTTLARQVLSLEEFLSLPAEHWFG